MTVPAAVVDLTSRVVGTVTLRVEAGEPPADFEPGPLPCTWGPDGVTDTALRATYMGQHAVPILYGDGVLSQRSHRTLALDADPQGQFGQHVSRMRGVELFSLALPTDYQIRLLIIHLEVEGPRAVRVYQDLARQLSRGSAGDGQLSVADLAGSDVVGGGRRFHSSTLVMTERGTPLGPSDAAPAGWTRTERLLWDVASLTPPGAFPVDESDPDALSGMVHLSATWRALALRDGIGYVWAPPARQGSDFLGRAEVLVRTIYTDVGILAKVQRELLVHLLGRLASLDRFSPGKSDLASLADSSLLLHQRLWVQDVSEQGHANQLLRAAQDQLRTPALFRRLAEDIAVFRSEIDSMEILRTRVIQEQLSRRQAEFQRQMKQLAGLLAGASLVLGALGVNLAGVTSGEGIGAWPAVLLVLLGAGLGYLIARLVTTSEARLEAEPPAAEADARRLDAR